MKHPLDRAVEEDGVVEVGDLPVEPEVDAGNGSGVEMVEILTKRDALGGVRKHAIESIERQSEDQVVEDLFLVGDLIRRFEISGGTVTWVGSGIKDSRGRRKCRTPPRARM